jgi:hypothetical protein
MKGLKKGPNLADFVLKKEIERFKLQYIDSSSKPKIYKGFFDTHI